MKVIEFQDEKSWLDFRLGKISGTRLKDVLVKKGGKPKIGFYELLAERICVPPSDENSMERGKRLEEIALEKFAKETGKKVTNDLVVWQSDEDPNIIVSPDGVIKSENSVVEVKCLSSARHLEAMITKEIPAEYEMQVLQHFITNQKLKTLYFVFFDPRCPKDMFFITKKREDIQEMIDEYLELEKEVLSKISALEDEFTF